MYSSIGAWVIIYASVGKYRPEDRDPSEDQGVDGQTKPKMILELAGLRLIRGGP